MSLLVDLSLKQYVAKLASKEPAPGGGSAAALTGALGASLVAMSANYSRGKGRTKLINRRIDGVYYKAKALHEELLKLVDLDAKAYQAVVDARKKDIKIQKEANRQAKKIPKQIGKACRKGVELLPYLIKNGNQYLLSDMHAAGELLFAGYRSSLIMIEANS